MITIKYAKGDKKGEIFCVLATRKKFVNFVIYVMSSMAAMKNIDEKVYLGRYGFKFTRETNGKNYYTNPDAFTTCLHYLMDNGEYYVEVKLPVE